jgi:hypothetical protein
MFVNILLKSLFLFEVQILLLSFAFLVRVFRFPGPLMISVGIKRRITMKYVKSKVDFYSISIDLQNICIECILKIGKNCWLKVESFIYLLVVIKGQQKRNKSFYEGENM